MGQRKIDVAIVQFVSIKDVMWFDLIWFILILGMIGLDFGLHNGQSNGRKRDEPWKWQKHGKNISFVQKVVLWNDNHESGGEGADQIPHHGRYLWSRIVP